MRRSAVFRCSSSCGAFPSSPLFSRLPLFSPLFSAKVPSAGKARPRTGCTKEMRRAQVGGPKGQTQQGLVEAWAARIKEIQRWREAIPWKDQEGTGSLSWDGFPRQGVGISPPGLIFNACEEP